MICFASARDPRDGHVVWDAGKSLPQWYVIVNTCIVTPLLTGTCIVIIESTRNARSEQLDISIQCLHHVMSHLTQLGKNNVAKLRPAVNFKLNISVTQQLLW